MTSYDIGYGPLKGPDPVEVGANGYLVPTDTSTTVEPGLPSLEGRRPGDQHVDNTDPSRPKTYVVVGEVGKHFRDDFTRPDSTYVNVAGSDEAYTQWPAGIADAWEIVGNSARSRGEYRMLSRPFGPSPVKVSTRILPGSGSAPGVYSHAPDVGGAHGGLFAQVKVGVAGTNVYLKRETQIVASVDSGQVHTAPFDLALEVQADGTVSVLVDGTSRLTYVDANVPQGGFCGIGSGTGEAEAFFDFLEIVEPDRNLRWELVPRGNVTSQEPVQPTGADEGDLWFDAERIAYRWDGVDWVSVRDSGIEQAIADSGIAIASANGKNAVYYAATAPSGTDHQVDDTWFDTDNGFALHRWDGTDWVPAPIGHQAIASLDLGKATVGLLNGQYIEAESITAAKLATIGQVANGANRIEITDQYGIALISRDAAGVDTVKVGLDIQEGNGLFSGTIIVGNAHAVLEIRDGEDYGLVGRGPSVAWPSTDFPDISSPRIAGESNGALVLQAGRPASALGDNTTVVLHPDGFGNLTSRVPNQSLPDTSVQWHHNYVNIYPPLTVHDTLTVRDGVKQKAIRKSKTTSQSLPASTWTSLTSFVTDYEHGAWTDSSSYIRVPNTGWYLVTFRVGTNANGARFITHLWNSTKSVAALRNEVMTGSPSPSINNSGLVYLVLDDYMYVQAWSSVAASVVDGDFAMLYLGPGL